MTCGCGETASGGVVTAVPDLLAHALLGYTLATGLRHRLSWVTPAYVTVCMAGALIPDTSKVFLVVPDGVVESALGVPFSWYALHTVGGVTVAVLIGVVLVDRGERARVFGLLSLGAVSHLVADGLLFTVSGYSKPMLWPVTRVAFPTPGLYLSTEPTPLVVAGTVAVVVRVAVRRRVND